MRRLLFLAALFGLALLPGCVFDPGSAPHIDAKGFGGEEEARKAIVNALKWLRYEVASARSRNFSLSPDSLDYRGHDSELRESVEALRGEPQRFAAVQQLLGLMMREAAFGRIIARFSADAASDDRMSSFGEPTALSVLRDGILWFRVSAVNARMQDPRRLLLLLVSEVFRLYAFGSDETAVRFFPGFGETAAPSVAIPSLLSGATNRFVKKALGLELVLLSADYRFGLDGDDPDPSGVSWSKVVEDDFGGAGGTTAAQQNISFLNWDFAGSNPTQANGYWFGRWATPFLFVKRPLRDVRVTASLLFHPTTWADERFRIFTRRSERPTEEIYREGTMTAQRRFEAWGVNVSGKANEGSSCSFNVNINNTPLSQELRVEVSLTLVGTSAVIRVNGATACYYVEQSTDAGEVGVFSYGVSVDRVRVDEGR